MTTGYYAIAIQLDLNWWFQPALAIIVQYAFHVVWVCRLTRKLIMPSLLSLTLSQSPPPSFFVKYPKSGRLGTQQRHTCSALPQLPPNIFLFLRWEDTSIHQSCQASGPLGAGALCGTRLISLLWLACFGTNTLRLPGFLLSRCVRLCALYRNKELWDFRNSMRFSFFARSISYRGPILSKGWHLLWHFFFVDVWLYCSRSYSILNFNCLHLAFTSMSDDWMLNCFFIFSKDKDAP